MKQVYTNAKIFTGYQIIDNGHVVCENGQVLSVSAGHFSGVADQLVDMSGRLLAPGLIDLQVYGGNGKLFNNEPTVETIRQTWTAVQAGGAGSFQITLSCSPWTVMEQAIEACREYWAGGGAGLLGLHLEGPYFNTEKRGAHPAEHIRKANEAEIAQLIELGHGVVTYITLAPEMVDDASLKLLLDSGIIVSAGHSNASFEQGVTGFKNGIRCATHLFNAMSALQGRSPGMVGAIYDQKPYTSIIADGVHIDYASLNISHQILGDRLFLITDAVTESLMGDYQFRFAGDRYVDTNGTLAGSSLTMLDAVANTIQYAGIEPREAWRMASLYPAKAAGLSIGWGEVVPGSPAVFFLEEVGAPLHHKLSGWLN